MRVRRQRPRREKKKTKTGYSTASKFATHESMLIRLVHETVKHQDLKTKRESTLVDSHDLNDKVAQQRGVVRGMALFVAKMWGNGYEDYIAREVKSIERWAMRTARELIDSEKRNIITITEPTDEHIM